MQSENLKKSTHADAILRASVTNHDWSEDKEKPSYQLKALFIRAYYIQKRQMFTNILCIGLCPFLIIFISTILGVIANQIFNNITISGKLIVC